MPPYRRGERKKQTIISHHGDGRRVARALGKRAGNWACCCSSGENAGCPLPWVAGSWRLEDLNRPPVASSSFQSPEDMDLLCGSYSSSESESSLV